MTTSPVFDNVSFKYRRNSVLHAFSHEFGAGSTLLLGPNGAGKSTLLQLAAGVLAPREGTVVVDGASSTDRAERGRYLSTVGFMPQRISAMPGLSVREQVAYVGWLKGKERSDAWDDSWDALGYAGLQGLADRATNRLSGGELRRVGIAQTLIMKPGVVLLDEPTVGLDPIEHARFQDVLDELRGSVNFIVSTHQAEDVSNNFDHVAVLADGTLRFSGSVAEFFSRADPSQPKLLSAYTNVIGAQ